MKYLNGKTLLAEEIRVKANDKQDKVFMIGDNIYVRTSLYMQLAWPVFDSRYLLQLRTY